jgi:hypothetical protein
VRPGMGLFRTIDGRGSAIGADIAAARRSARNAHEVTLSDSQIQPSHLNQISGSNAEITINAKPTDTPRPVVPWMFLKFMPYYRQPAEAMVKTCRFAEQDAVDADDELEQRASSLFNGTPAQIIAVETQKVEGDQRGLRSAALG